jgi:hypothetical protein
MKLPWFKRIGIFYFPVSVIGWLLLIASLLYTLYVFVDLNNTSHSVSDLMINFVFSILIIGAVYTLIAFFTCRNNR